MGNCLNRTGYRIAFIRCALLVSAGVVLQLVTGSPDKSFLGHPWGVIMAVNYLYLLILSYYCSEKRRWIRNLFDHYSMTVALASMTLACIVLGFSDVVSTWPFIIIFLNFISVLGWRSIDDVVHWRTRRILPSVIHVSVFIIMTAGIFSSGDKVRVRVIAPVGHPVCVGMTESGKSHTLPFSITLRKFTIEEYPPQIYIMNRADGTMSKESVSLDEDVTDFMLEGWTIKVLKMLESSGKTSESESYVAMNHVGTMPAVLIEATDGTGEKRTGWVSCGSHIFPSSMLELDESCGLVMPPCEAASYVSDILIHENDTEQSHEVRVNHPAETGPWKIYQVSYDKDRGRWSTISVFECVRDGWYPVIRVSLWLLLAAGIAMTFSAGIKRKRKEDRS